MIISFLFFIPSAANEWFRFSRMTRVQIRDRNRFLKGFHSGILTSHYYRKAITFWPNAISKSVKKKKKIQTETLFSKKTFAEPEMKKKYKVFLENLGKIKNSVKVSF